MKELNEDLEGYITNCADNYPGAIRDWVMEEKREAVRKAFDLLYLEIDADEGWGGAKQRAYNLMDKLLKHGEIN